MDALSQILDALKFKVVVYNRMVVTTSWGLNVLQGEVSHFWRVVKGRCFIKVPNEPMVELHEGDLAFIPRGQAHWLADDPTTERMSARDFVKARDSGSAVFVGDREETILLGGHFEFDTKQLHPFIKSLPEVIYITNNKEEVSSWLQKTSALVFEETRNERPGSKLILSRLAEVAYVHLIRSHLEQTENASGFLLALKDERISKTLSLMQGFPEREWTLDMLSTEAGMSRSLFCNKFKEFVGDTPLGYLTIWRMMKAKELLLNKGNIKDIAMKVGYQSEAAFNRIFKKDSASDAGQFQKSGSCVVGYFKF